MKDTIFCVLNVLVSVVLIILSLRYVTDYWLLAFVYSLQTHIAIVCIAVILFSLLLKRHWYTGLLLVVGLFLAIHPFFMLREFATAPERAHTDQRVFRLMSFNILNSNFSNGEKIADAIIASNADVAFILEAPPIASQVQRISQVYPYRVGCGEGMPKCGIVVFSKRPILDSTIRSLSDLWSNRLVRVAIDLDGQPVNFIAVQLAKPYFDEFHTFELYNLSRVLRDIKGPLVLAGDFNSAMIAPDMQRFLRTNDLKNMFPEPTTWPILAGRYGISIDHVFARAPLQLKSVNRIEDNMGSNHFGLMSEFVIRQ
ncbi:MULTISPECIES: endonuclease/exonuclease/phosphatase family protein [unclassified Sinorhizobium]|uniref:endonuclease/exonuclease/phosphatase family protein n=1 Tax=unclassified Sinorhizobium TaxID=2613772 RepID=UPI0035251AAD